MRYPRLAENLFYELARAGVQVLIADMPTYNGKDRKDVLIRQIREAIAEENRKDIIERLWKGRQERVRRGLPPGGNVAYGYRRVGRTLEIDDGEAAVVRMIFDHAALGYANTEIAKRLNAHGLTRRNLKPWSRRQVTAVLAQSPLYKSGLLRYGDATGSSVRLRLFDSANAEP